MNVVLTLLYFFYLFFNQQNLPTSSANPNVYNQVQVVNQGSPYTYPDVNSTNVVQQSNIRPIYGFNP
jgi:hypothetical protein